jgi:hypothetical protein
MLTALLTLALPARAEDVVSGLGQDVIQITSNYTGVRRSLRAATLSSWCVARTAR